MRSVLRLVTASLVAAVFMVGCCNSPGLLDQVDELQSQVDGLESKLADIESEFDDVLSGMRYLESEIDDFDYEDWETNVPEVVDAFDDLRREVSDLEHEF